MEFKKERRRQSLAGVIAVKTTQMRDIFNENYGTTDTEFDKLFKKLKQARKVIVVNENQKELMAWVE